MNQAKVSKLVSQLKIKVPEKKRNLKSNQGSGSLGRLNKLRKTVTALLKHERLELNFHTGDETRQYTERLISEAIRHGDTHKTTMELADYWILEKQLIHKLFKVLVPRFQDYDISFTRMYKAPRFDGFKDRSVLELRGNPYPSLKPQLSGNRNLIHNVLLDAAKFDFRQQKYAEIADQIGSTESSTVSVEETSQKEVAKDS